MSMDVEQYHQEIQQTGCKELLHLTTTINEIDEQHVDATARNKDSMINHQAFF
jgi:hypothetical protein